MKILFILGANLKYLGNREPEIYGNYTIDDIFNSIKKDANDYEIKMIATNSEGEIIDAIMEEEYDALIINPGAYTHYSIAIYDALLAKKDVFKVEVHMTNVYNREEMRHNMVTTAAVDAVIMGMGNASYNIAIETVKKYFKIKMNRRTYEIRFRLFDWFWSRFT